jgi:hypothetical protein
MIGLFGYLDPGTGSLFLQAIIGGALGVVFLFRKYIVGTVSKVKKALKRDGRKPEAPQE